MSVYSQTFPYVSFMGENLPNHSYVDLSLVGSSDGKAVQCHTDLATCCRHSQGAHRGDWYFPNRSRLSFSGGDDDIFQKRLVGSVNLTRTNDVLSPSGIYHCHIATISVHDDGDRESVYVGFYGSGGIFNSSE